MALLSPYDLPFSMTVPAPGDLARGRTLDLRIWKRGALGEPQLQALGGVVTAWGILAKTGAMAGADLPAATSGLDDWAGPMVAAGSTSWVLSGVRLDDRAAIVLAHLLLSEWDEARFDRVELLDPTVAAAPQVVVFDPKVAEPYPAIDRTVRFPYLVGDEPMEEVVVRLRFSAVLDVAQREHVSTQLLTWAAVAGGGAYAVAPNEPLECGLVPETELEWVDEELEWALAKVQLHPGAFAGLVNVVAALDQGGLAVRDLSVE
jgi:hypothetical protein